jgi:hypothetical protein
MSADDRVAKLVRRYEALRSRGEQPTLEALCLDGPELIEPVRRALRAPANETRKPTASTAFGLSSGVPGGFDDPDGVASCLGPAQAPGEIGRLGP